MVQNPSKWTTAKWPLCCRENLLCWANQVRHSGDLPGQTPCSAVDSGTWWHNCVMGMQLFFRGEDKGAPWWLPCGCGERTALWFDFPPVRPHNTPLFHLSRCLLASLQVSLYMSGNNMVPMSPNLTTSYLGPMEACFRPIQQTLARPGLGHRLSIWINHCYWEGGIKWSFRPGPHALCPGTAEHVSRAGEFKKGWKRREKNSSCHILTHELLPKLFSLWDQFSSQVIKSLSPSPSLEQFLLWSLTPDEDCFLCIKNSKIQLKATTMFNLASGSRFACHSGMGRVKEGEKAKVPWVAGKALSVASWWESVSSVCYINISSCFREQTKTSPHLRRFECFIFPETSYILAN